MIRKIKKDAIWNRNNNRIYYHYTSLGTLWAILENDDLRATNARFSNDSEEVTRGRDKVIDQLVTEYERLSSITNPSQEDTEKLQSYLKLTEYLNCFDLRGNSEIDCYIICFCGSNDKLSQWRAYCRDDGVSIGFEFNDSTEYCFMDEPVGKQAMHKATLRDVYYVKDNNSIAKNNGGNRLPDNLSKVVLDAIEDENDFHLLIKKIESVIPRIKHSGFEEEDEYRLIILNTDHLMDQYIKHWLDGGVNKPYLNISFGKKYDIDLQSKEPAMIQLRVESQVQKIAFFNFDDDIKDKIREITREWKNVRISFSMTKEKQFVIVGEGSDEQQKEYLKKIEDCLRECYGENVFLEQKIKIWFKGHLPIRSITVSPCRNKQEVIESIRHYCRHEKFWLKYVDVNGSETPYRRPK